ncbi:uncharacterized protein SOCEGT47_076530 [Sorangium cellulosum]|jgi:hypothetical protein|uniref:Uncharacterized protein n=1 Tax=Sorangium cellulosum TaxID=56 RepID=A0A4P2QBJ2_SORCE|nr:hypothetical protein [Sorangium cellulosum]AUX27074.1 uncharacterized protein SOCEGT47_076530 [Sorangium cellulosum]
MGAGQSLKDVLKKKKRESDEVAARVDWEARKRERVAAIKELYDNIERWLKPSQEEGVAELSREPYELWDHHMGTYSSERLKLDVGHIGVEFVPLGEKVAGASARVDAISGPHRLTMIHLPGQGWKLLLRGQVVAMAPLTEESFADALEELLEG